MIDPHLRIGDAERSRALAALDKASADGRLTVTEHDDRADRARAARTRGELATLLIDVLPQLAVDELVGGVQPRTGFGPGYSWDDPLELTAKWHDEKRLGWWEVPPYLEASPIAGNVKLNFTEAVPVALVIDIVLLGRAGNLVLVVPSDWGVDVSRVTKGMGTVKSSVSPKPAPGAPLLVVRGENKMGNLVARYANRYDTWQNGRELAKQARFPALGT